MNRKGIGLLSVLGACLLVLAFSTPSRAGVLGICTGWSWAPPNPDCVPETTVFMSDIGVTSSSNPVFTIQANDGADTLDTLLLILVPHTAETPGPTDLEFTVTFTNLGPDGETFPTVDLGTHTVLNVSALTDLFERDATADGERLIADVIIPNGVENFAGDAITDNVAGNDWHFESVKNVNILENQVTSFSVYAVAAGFGILGPTVDGGATAIKVEFGDFVNGTGFIFGTTFLAAGLNSPTVSVYMPLTMGLERVPEPGSLLLLGTGLAGLAGYARKKRARARKA